MYHFFQTNAGFNIQIYEVFVNTFQPLPPVMFLSSILTAYMYVF